MPVIRTRVGEVEVVKLPDNPDRSPAVNKLKFICPRCHVFATQDWYIVFSAKNGNDAHGLKNIRALSQASGNYSPADDPWRASVCFGCKNPSLWHGEELAWPLTVEIGPAPVSGFPESALELFEEGRRVGAISRRAGAALLRAALERLVGELVPGRGTLFDKIGELQDRVSPGLSKALDVLRTAGNGVLHDNIPSGVAAVVVAEGVDQSAIFAYLCGVLNRLVEEAITGPAQDDELYALLPESVRDSIDRRDGAND